MLEKVIDQCSKKGLLDELLLMQNAEMQLLQLIEKEIAENHQLSQPINRLLRLIASKLHEASGIKTSEYLRKERNETGIQERLIRFQNHFPN